MEQSYGIMGMPGVGFFGMLLIGFIAGYVAERTMNRDHGLLTNILVASPAPSSAARSLA